MVQKSRRVYCKIEATIHPASDLASFLVTPADGGKVRLVVHEATVEFGLGVWVRRCDVNLSTTGRIFQVLEPVK